MYTTAVKKKIIPEKIYRNQDPDAKKWNLSHYITIVFLKDINQQNLMNACVTNSIRKYASFLNVCIF